jgi:hypothetical protein
VYFVQFMDYAYRDKKVVILLQLIKIVTFIVLFVFRLS